MPRFRGSCGCYNRQDAREIGLIPAIVWNDMIDRAEHFDSNPMWYDQKEAADRLGIEYHRLNRAVKILEEVGRIKLDGGFRPNSRVRTTWVTILIDEVNAFEISNSNSSNEQNGDFEMNKTVISILNDTNNDTDDGKSQNDGHMLPSALYSKLRSVFPGSSNDMRKKKVEAVERLQNEFELSDETIIDGVSEIAKHPTYKFKDGTEFTETLASLLLGDIEKTAEKLVKKAEAGRMKEEKKKKKISRSQAMLNAGVC